MIEALKKAREALAQMLVRDECNTCPHDSTHRGGAIWEICDDCGAQWADDRGGKPKWEEPKQWNAAREAIAAIDAALAQADAPADERKDGMPAAASERHLRRLLAQYVGMPHAYYDDGEAQGQQHGIVIDFMREPVADIDAKLRALGVARYECEKARAASAPAAPKEQQP